MGQHKGYTRQTTNVYALRDGWVGWQLWLRPYEAGNKKAWRIQGPDDSDCREPDDTSRRESESGMCIDERVAMSEKWEPKRKLGEKTNRRLSRPRPRLYEKARVNKAPT